MRRRRLFVALLALLVPASALPPLAGIAQAADPGTGVTFTVEPVDMVDPVGTSTVTGLAVLTPRDGDTAANVLAVGAPAGAMAVIHAGTCAAIDPTPTGLLGDVGTTGQLAAVVPVAFATVADGGHVLAFHPGLDLATALACGAIPAAAAGPVDQPTPGPDTTSEPAGDRFESATYGFSLAWDDPWQRQEWDPGEGYEGLSLSDGTSSVSFVGFELAGGDATACIRDWEGRLLGLLRGGTIADLQPVVDDQGQPVGSGDTQRAVGSYQYLYKTQDDPAGSLIIERDECRRLSDGAVLEITTDMPLDAPDTERALVDALVAGLTLGEPVVTPTSAPVVTPPPVEPTTAPATAAAPTTAPDPTPDPSCAGMDAWVEGTLARFDAIKAMGDDIAATMNAGMAAYAQALADTSLAIQRLQIEQQQSNPPASATDAQASVIKMLQKLAEAYDLMSQAYVSGNTAVLQQGLSAAGEAQGLATAARTAIRQVATPCGITVPAA